MSAEKTLIGELIDTARKARTLRAELLLKHGLYAGQDTLLKSLEANDGQTMGQLAANLRVRPPTVTKMVTRMASQGFLIREASEVDTRQTHVFLTTAGRKLIKKVDKVWKNAEQAAMAGMKDKQAKQLGKALAKLSENLEIAAQKEKSP